MKPTSRELALRDPALASALGIVGHGRADFGSDYGRPRRGFGFGADGYTLNQLCDMSADRRSAYLAQGGGIADLHPAQVAQIVDDRMRSDAETSRRERLLFPNRGSSVDVERYDFSLQQSIVIGTATTLAMSTQPAVTVRPQRCTFNAPVPGLVTISAIQVANVNGLVGQSVDAWVYGPQSYGVHLDLPTLSPANKLSISGASSTLTPPGIPIAFSFPFTASFQCPATVVA